MLENDYIRLRPIEPEDLEKLYQWENDPSLWEASDTHTPYSRYAIKQYIANSKQDIYEDKQLRLIIEEKATREATGTLDLFDFDLHNSRISLGLFVDSRFQGKGYAKQALRLVEEYIF
ncbi:MAG: GNAT family N-acetyltransferase, partial [Prevotellaceae bacterium]|nr:GNAT family N-acetyltransferase [Prevotellaceae bacterium]